MRLSISIHAAVAMGLGLTACGESTTSRKADVVIAPADLARELAGDRETAFAKYDGKILELSGSVGKKIEPGGLNPTLGVAFASIDERLAFDANLSFVSFDGEDGAARSEFEGLAVGDAVTLRCRFQRLGDSTSSRWVTAAESSSRTVVGPSHPRLPRLARRSCRSTGAASTRDQGATLAHALVSPDSKPSANTKTP